MWSIDTQAGYISNLTALVVVCSSVFLYEDEDFWRQVSEAHGALRLCQVKLCGLQSDWKRRTGASAVWNSGTGQVECHTTGILGKSDEEARGRTTEVGA